ncbi:MAG: FHA domain-containing protein [Prevotellaceae bacterium]|nr:FHA domain-containing protein [Prevotellaceae bacterium]
MKKVRCPKCNTYTFFDETRYQLSQRLVFICSQCNKQFAIKTDAFLSSVDKKNQENVSSASVEGVVGTIVVVENAFHFRQEIQLEMGDNVFGRYVHGTNINKPIETVDPSVDTRHCIIRVQRDKNGQLQYILRDAPSGTGTFYMNEILRNQDRIRLQDGSVVTIGATTLILKLSEE